MAWGCNISGIPLDILEMAGYYKRDENDEFIVFFHKEGDQVVQKTNPILYVEDVNDAAFILSKDVIALGDPPA